ncbi:MAG: hypothetical protein J6B79_06595 [Clostridia bacterium]|nr:hypothetical protein [Clostridia bacterium]
MDYFIKAKPVWIEGRENELNSSLTLKARADFTGAKLYITANNFYRLCVDGKFVSFGPARTAKGYARVDIIDLSAFSEGEITIEVAGYACRSLSTVKASSFVTAELRKGDEVLLATGYDFDGFTTKRVQKVKRYSVQRHFSEVWDYNLDEKPVTLCTQPQPKYLDRVAPYAVCEDIEVKRAVEKGVFEVDESKSFRERYSFFLSDYWGYYKPDEVQGDPTKMVNTSKLTVEQSDVDFPVVIKSGQYVVADFGQIETGFLSATLKSEEGSDIILAFTEVREDGFFTQINAHNTVEIITDGKPMEFYSFEPYVCRYLALFVKSGSVTLEKLGVRTFVRDMTGAKEVKINDRELQAVYEAAKRTFAHNALDLYFDCPSRERAGWLCDSWFTGRVEHFLMGNTQTEDAFLENYRLYEWDGEIEEGFVPMCYPADVEVGGKFIPQWTMWYVYEVCEYLTKRNTTVDKELFRDSVYTIMNALARYETEEGLLCRLPSWNFVEWSTANQWTKDINWPTNALYCQILECVGTLYGEREKVEKANRLRCIIEERAFDGELFVDNAVEQNGVMVNTRNSSEACQYYMTLFCKIDIDVPRYSALKAYIKDGFESFDKTKKPFVEVNAFIGFYLRICTLIEKKEWEVLARDCKKFFGGMVEKTNTLWEYKTVVGSQDHGFASYAAIAIDLIAKNLK